MYYTRMCLGSNGDLWETIRSNRDSYFARYYIQHGGEYYTKPLNNEVDPKHIEYLQGPNNLSNPEDI